MVCSALCDAIDDNQKDKIDRHGGMFLEMEKVLRSQLLSPTPSIEGEEAVKYKWLSVKDLSELFKNSFNCYADTESENPILAMTEERFIEVIKLISQPIQSR